MRKLLRSYLEEVNYFLMSDAADQPIAEYDAAVLCNMLPANMTTQQYADNLVAKSCMVADVYDGEALKEEFIEGVEESIRHSLRHYWA